MSINAQVEGEHGSIVTMYYAFSKGATMGMIPEGKVPRTRTNPGKWDKWMQSELPAGLSPDLITALDDNVLKGNDKISAGSKATKAWVNTWANQAIEVGKYIGQPVNIGPEDTSATSTTSWMYGMFGKNPRHDDKAIPGIPTTKVSTCLQCVWDVISQLGDDSLKQAFGNPPKKDSWNPADTFMVDSTREGKIHDWCTKLVDEFTSGGVPFAKFVGTLNTELSNWVQEGALVPISLKAMTSGVTMSYKENNVYPFKGSGKINVVGGEFTEPPYAYFQIVDNRGADLDYKGNSFVFKASITAGAYKEGYEYQDDVQYYKVEQRLQGKSSKAEIKDVKVKDAGGFKDANNQTGIMPSKKFKDLITEYAGPEVGTYNKFIPPIGTAFSEYEISYWAKQYNGLKTSLRNIGIDLGDTTIFGKKYTAYWYFRRAAELDKLEGQAFTTKVIELGGKKSLKKGKFSAKLRNKCLNLRFMRAISNARKKHELCMLLTSIYYGAAKMKMTNEDLQGPFIKLS